MCEFCPESPHLQRLHRAIKAFQKERNELLNEYRKRYGVWRHNRIAEGKPTENTPGSFRKTKHRIAYLDELILEMQIEVRTIQEHWRD